MLPEPDPGPVLPPLTPVFTVDLSEGGEWKEFRTVEGVSIPDRSRAASSQLWTAAMR